jgi:hypothetical protein
LLHEAFSDLDNFSLGDFIAEDEEEETVYITTEKLMRWIVKKHIKWFLKSGQKEPAKIETLRIGEFLTHASRNIQEWEGATLAQDKVWVETVMNIKILIESLWYATDYRSLRQVGVVGMTHATPSISIIRKHMVERNGWCDHQFNSLCFNVSLLNLVYISQLRRYPRRDECEGVVKTGSP